MRSTRRPSRRLLGAAALAGALAAVGGCGVGQIFGAMAESYRRSSTKPVAAEYTGLQGKTCALVVSADRYVQSEDAGLVARLTVAMTQRLADSTGAKGWVAPQRVLQAQYNTPGWSAMDYSELAEALGVERLILVDLYEYRLNEPGNAYLWDGRAGATVGVVEADGPLAGEFFFSKEILVRFPDGSGFGPTDFPASTVSQRLQNRLIDRVTWLFFEHEEPYYPDY